MRIERIAALLFATTLAVAGVAPGRAQTERDAESADYRVIVNPANPVRMLGREFLRSAYLKKTTSWTDGQTIRPVSLGRRFAARERFTREVLGKSPAQLRAYWNQQIFSGKDVPPPELNSAAAVVAYVLRNRGAVGYLPVGADPAGAVVVTIK